MTTTLKSKLKKLPAARRKKINKRAKELIAKFIHCITIDLSRARQRAQ